MTTIGESRRGGGPRLELVVTYDRRSVFDDASRLEGRADGTHGRLAGCLVLAQGRDDELQDAEQNDMFLVRDRDAQDLDGGIKGGGGDVIGLVGRDIPIHGGLGGLQESIVGRAPPIAEQLLDRSLESLEDGDRSRYGLRLVG